MRLRKLLFWMHLLTGVAIGLVVLVMSVSGVLLSYERQIVALSDTGVRVAPPPAGPAQPSAERLAQALRSGLPRDVRLSRLTLKADAGAPALVSLSDGSTLLVDPYTGAVLKKSGARAVFHAIEDVHRALALGLLKHRDAGTSLTGACNAAFLFLIVSGLILWWPRKWSRRALRAVVWFDAQRRGRARDWNWHNVIGLWCALPLLIIVASGLLISYPSLLQLADTGKKAPAPGSQKSDAAPPNLDALFATAQQSVPGWSSVTMRAPAQGNSAVVFSISTGDGVRPTQVSRITLDAKSGATLKHQRYEEFGGVRKALAWGRWLHTGEAGGLAGQTVAALAAAGAVLLVWTGLSLAWRRFFRKKAAGAERDELPA